jgi:hypothetical protein
MFLYQCASFLTFISLSYTIYMLNLSCMQIACFHHVDNQCHILCLVIYMLQSAHMLNKDIRSLI